ncbi:hypothetical protein [Oceanospirillum linum]|nr:hypothetical protein [Oceanospirillum linum]
MGKAPVAKRENQGVKDNGKGAAKTGITFTHADEVISRLKNTAAVL